jgi:hypothetical protein
MRTALRWIQFAGLAALTLAAAAGAEIGIAAVQVEQVTKLDPAMCHLKVQIKNAGAKSAANFVLRVKVNGQEVPEYKRIVYVTEVASGKTKEQKLYTFYAPQTGKPVAVEVTILEAQWIDVKREGQNVTMTPLGAVPGLPAVATTSFELKK